jgi:hypothetical protein
MASRHCLIVGRLEQGSPTLKAPFVEGLDDSIVAYSVVAFQLNSLNLSGFLDDLVLHRLASYPVPQHESVEVDKAQLYATHCLYSSMFH